VFGLSASSKEQVSSLIEDMFGKLALQFIGAIPRYKGQKTIIISGRKDYGLPELFVQAMSNRSPNELEQDALRGFLDTANSYIDALKIRAKTNVIEQIDALARESKANDRKVDREDIQAILDTEMRKAKSSLKTIAESESTKLRNLGTLMNIGRLASNLGDDDPSVFFIVVKDDVTCEECKRLHLMPDGSTPRVWKLSELGQGYHKRGENMPSVFGLHPHCRCTLTYLSEGFGFDKRGKLKYHAQVYSEFKKQRE
jgi:hypothetical protein